MESIIENNFQDAIKEVNKLHKKPTEAELLTLYGLYKQALFGDNNTPYPAGFFNIKAQKKWNAWVKEKGKTMLQAKKEYTFYVKLLKIDLDL